MKFSIITPSFNQGTFVERTLRSVLTQQHQADVQYIVVDGGSTDTTRATLEKYREHLDQLITEPDDGQADAIRKGFARSSGEILGFLNSDDVLLPGTIQFVHEFFSNNPDVDAIYSNRIYIDADDRISDLWVLPPHSNYCMSRWDYIPQETCFWRRSLMDVAGTVDASYQFALDYDLFVRMMRCGQFKRVNRFLAAFRVHPNSKSTTLYETLGRQEVARVQKAQGITLRWYDHVLKYIFSGWILGSSFFFKGLAISVIRKRTTFPWQK